MPPELLLHVTPGRRVTAGTMVFAPDLLRRPDTAPAVPSRRPGVARSARFRGATCDDRGTVPCHACPPEPS